MACPLFALSKLGFVKSVLVIVWALAGRTVNASVSVIAKNAVWKILCFVLSIGCRRTQEPITEELRSLFIGFSVILFFRIKSLGTSRKGVLQALWQAKP